jgi:hypothetical protein
MTWIDITLSLAARDVLLFWLTVHMWMVYSGNARQRRNCSRGYIRLKGRCWHLSEATNENTFDITPREHVAKALLFDIQFLGGFGNAQKTLTPYGIHWHL